MRWQWLGPDKKNTEGWAARRRKIHESQEQKNEH